ncbi:MAG TPA: type II secretion system minor pseudopilin GspH [Steroidobacteraceae bacterium]|nr:type II secretion system minor pseudopilin GspH [Steroidobacteraceae bacterium]
MPTSVTGTSNNASRRHAAARRRASGFTLLEVLVVVVIIGIITSMAVISVNVLGGDHEMQQEAERLQAILMQAQEDATLQSRDLGLRLDETSFEFLEYDGRTERWRTVLGDPLLRERTLPPGLRLQLRLEDRDVQLKPREPATDRDPIYPQVILQASGEIVPFDVVFSRDGTEERRRVSGTVEGRIEVHDDRRESQR